jgi:hypothetical protein
MNAPREKRYASTVMPKRNVPRRTLSNVPVAARNDRLAATVRSLRSRPLSRRRSVDTGQRQMPKRPNREIGAMLWIAGTGFAGVIAGSMLLYLLT